MYLTVCINAENRDEGVENHSEGTSSLHAGQTSNIMSILSSKVLLIHIQIDGANENVNYLLKIYENVNESVAQLSAIFCYGNWVNISQRSMLALYVSK